MSTCVIYIDEAGSPFGHHIPLRNGETPIFTLAALAFPLCEWRARDRSFLSLKRLFFSDLLSNSQIRDEEYEIKGNELTSPHNKDNSRRQEFNRRLLYFISSNSGVGFGVTFLKNSHNPAPHFSIYTQALQILVERFNLYINEHSEFDNAILICDSRVNGIYGNSKDITVARSHMSYIFGNKNGKKCTNILEAPLFADSRLTAGLQIVDIFASNLFTNQYNYYIKDVEGSINYSHMQKYWPTVNELQFRSQQIIDGYPVYGYRIIDQRPIQCE